MNEPAAIAQPSNSDDEGLQPERTGLAWNRTFVVLAAAFGLLGVHSYRDGLSMVVLLAAAVGAILVLVVSSWFSRARAHEARTLVLGEIRRLSVLPIALLALVTAALALSSLLLILFRG